MTSAKILQNATLPLSQKLKMKRDMSYREELRKALERAQEIIVNRWSEMEEDDCCTQAAEVLEMLITSLEED